MPKPNNTPDNQLRHLMALVLTDPMYAIEYANQIDPALYQHYQLVRIVANFNQVNAEKLFSVVRLELIDTLEGMI